MPLNLNIPQHNFYTMEKPFRAFVGGYRSGKTFLGCVRLCVLALEYPSIRLGYFAPTYPQIRDIFFTTISEVAELMGMEAEVVSSNNEVHLRYYGEHHATVKCRSMEHPQRIVGFDINHALIDEIDCMKQDKADQAWKKIVARLSSRGFDETRIYDEEMSCDLVIEALGENTVDFTTTPEGFNWVHDLFVKQLREDPELQEYYGIVHASTRQNAKNLPPDYIDKLYATYPSNLVSAYVDGQFVNLTSGTVYTGYDRARCSSREEVEGSEQLFVGMDFNVTKMAATIYVKRKDAGRIVWHAVDEIKDGYDTPEMITILQERYPDNRITVYPDSSGKNRKTVGASTSDIAMLSGCFEVRAKTKNPFVKDRVLSVNKAFEDGIIRVNELKCPTVADNLEQQVYDKNGQPDKTGNKDHQNDATGYPIAYEFPINKPAITTDIRMAY